MKSSRSTRLIPIPTDIAYYDHEANWRRINRHLKAPEVQAQMVTDMNKYTWGKWRRRFTQGMLPSDVDSCDWRLSTPRRSQPAYWNYVTWSACHWLVNLNLMLAQRVEPDRPWRILTSPDHSTVWDGNNTLFDFNFCALDVAASEAFKLATRHREAEVLAPGQLRKVFCPEHYRRDQH